MLNILYVASVILNLLHAVDTEVFKTGLCDVYHYRDDATKKIMINAESVYFFVKPRKYCDLYDLRSNTKSDWFDCMRSEIRSQDLHDPDEAKKYIQEEVLKNLTIIMSQCTCEFKNRKKYI